MNQQQYDNSSFDCSNEYYASEDAVAADAGSVFDAEYATEYWRLDEEAKSCFYDVGPDAFGESVSLGDLNELCRRMGRPIRDDSEHLRLVTELDTTDQMLILRHDFVTRLLQDLITERELESARLFVRENRAVPVAEPVWKEIVLHQQDDDGVNTVASSLMAEPSTPSKYFYNVVTGESKWELPSFVHCLWDHIAAIETKRAMAQSTATDANLLLLTDESNSSSNVEMLQDLRSLFTKYDDDGSGALDGTESEDLCVAADQPLTGISVRDLMREVDPFSAQEAVSWDAFSYYWVTNAPFQRRTRLDREGFVSWERVDVLRKKNLPVLFRNSNSLVERWSHPEMEQNVVNLLQKLFPSTKLDWKKKIALFFQVQFENLHNGGSSSEKQAQSENSTSESTTMCSWNLSQCARVLSQLGHPMTRKRHLEAALQQIQAKFAGDRSSNDAATKPNINALDEATVTNWFLYSIRKVEMRGWEEMVEPSSRGSIARFLVLADELKIQQIFRVLDTGRDGSVSLGEFKLWRRMKLQLEEEETEDAKLEKRTSQRRELSSQEVQQLVCFESDLLPRLVAVLGKYQLKGLTYRNALNELVKDALNQEVQLEDFLVWFDAFEALEREKEEIEEAKVKAQAELHAQELKAIARAKEKRMKHDDEARRKRIESLFKAFDANGSGFLDEKELQQLTKALGHEMDAMQAHQMMQAMDTSGDRQVSLDEFLTFWTAFQRKESPVKTSKAGNTAMSTSDPGTLPLHRKAGKAKGSRPSVVEATASLSVGLELAKSRMLKFSLDGFKEALGDWKDELADKRDDKKKQQLAVEEALEQKRQWSTLIPTEKHRYAHFDVTRIEPEVVECVVDMIQQTAIDTQPLLPPDAAQVIQKIAKGYVTRNLVFRMVEARFHQHADSQTRFFYYEDCETGKVLLERPLYRFNKMSTIAPFEFEDCDSKFERYEFHKRQREMRAKQRFCESNRLAEESPFMLMKKQGSVVKEQRSLFVSAVFHAFDISQMVQKRLLGDIWTRCETSETFVTAANRSSDGASYLPLHYVVRHPQFPLRVVRAIASGYSDALREPDAFGMTPLHLAFRERRSSMDLIRLLIQKEARSKPSIWEMKTRCGDTPLHVAVLHRAPIELMRWVLSSNLVSIDTVCSRNMHGKSPFHIAIRQYELSSSSLSTSYSKAIIHTFFKHLDAERLCSFRTKQGDLPLHLAMDAFEKSKQQQQSTTENASWVWLTRYLATQFPIALLIRKAGNGLLPIHLAIKYEFPAGLVREMWEWTLRAIEEDRPKNDDTLPSPQSKAMTVLEWTMIPQTRTTLLPYAILYQSDALELVQSILARMPEACSMKCVPNDELPLRVAVTATTDAASISKTPDDANGRSRVVRLLCEHYVAGCQVYNRQGKLPIHSAIASGQSADVIQILIESSPFVLTTNKQERNGLRALILAASTKKPDYAVLAELLELTPSAKLTLKDVTKRPVTPLYAISMRPCHHENQQEKEHSAATGRSAVLTKFSTNFEQIEDEDAYFLEMAKSKMRRKHHSPTAQWDYHQILRLMDINPVDEAVIQRSFLAINNKLQALIEKQSECNQDDGVDSPELKQLADAAVAAIALGSELSIVRRIHQIMYEFPSNARVQVKGQGILKRLLPTAFAKAAYKSKIDPYFNL